MAKPPDDERDPPSANPSAQEDLDDDEMTLTFQLYAPNLAANTRAEAQGPRLAELRFEGGLISGTDTVAEVKQRVLPSLLAGRVPTPHVTFVFSGQEMLDDALFYADHFMMLPAWVQVVLSDVPFAEVLATLRRLRE